MLRPQSVWLSKGGQNARLSAVYDCEAARRNVQGAKANDYSRMRLIWPVRGERRSCQSGGLQDAKRIAVAFASVGHAAALPVHFFLPLFKLLCCGDAFACGVDEVFRYNGPHD